MAVLPLQSPTSPNVTGGHLVYTLYSPSSSNAQFRYVTDIYDNDTSEFITRIKTYPNLNGTSNIDIGRELNDQMSYDYNWKTTGSVDPVNTLRTFGVKLGEEYASSMTGDVVTYPGAASNLITVFPGDIYENQGSFNFNPARFTTTGSNILSNCPSSFSTDSQIGFNEAYLMNSTDYFTVTTYEDVTGLTPGEIRVGLVTLSNDGASAAAYYFNITASNPEGSFSTWGFGPQNMADYNASAANLISTGQCQVIFTANTSNNIVIYLNDKWDGRPYKGTGTLANAKGPLKSCNAEYVRFAFINQFGFWDYYNVYNQVKKNTRVDRNDYTRPFIRYEDTVASYNSSDRGKKHYYTEYEDTYSVETNYIDEGVADWLQELFDSPEVFVQEGSEFIPIHIVNTDITLNMTNNRNKLFQYEIQYRYANERQPR